MNVQSGMSEIAWWTVLVRGLVALALGLVAFAWPALTVTLLVMILGMYMLVDGAIAIVDAIRYRARIRRGWLWLLEGVLSFALGVLMLGLPAMTAHVVVVAIAIWAAVAGALRIVAAIELRKRIRGEGLLVAGGALSIALGLLLVALPGVRILWMAWLVGAWAIAFGLLFIGLALRLRNAAHAPRMLKPAAASRVAHPSRPMP